MKVQSRLKKYFSSLFDSKLKLNSSLHLRLIASLLCFAIIANLVSPLSTLLTAGPGAVETAAPISAGEQQLGAGSEADAINTLYAATDIFRTADIEKVAPPSLKAPLGLGGQYLESFDPKTKTWVKKVDFSSGEAIVGVEDRVPGDYARDVRFVTNEEGRFTILLSNSKGMPLHRQVIPDIKAKKILVDGDLIVILDIDNKIWGIDHVLLRKHFMSGAVPSLEAYNLQSKIAPGADVEIVFHNPQKPLFDMPDAFKDAKEKLFLAGDIAIIDTSNEGRRLLGTLEKSALESDIFQEEANLVRLLPELTNTMVPNNPDYINRDDPAAKPKNAYQEFLLSGSPAQAGYQSPVVELLSDPIGRQQSADMLNALNIVKATPALYYFDANAVSHMIESGTKASTLKDESEATRLRYSYQQWVQMRNANAQRALEATQNLEKISKTKSQRVKEFCRDKIFTPQLFTKIAMLATLGSLWYLTSQSADVHVIQWKLWLYEHLSKVSKVFTKPEYADIALRNSIIYTAVVPTIMKIAQITNKLIPSHRSLTSIKSLAIAGLRTFAVTCQFFTRTMAKLFGQRLLMEAAKNGVNPFRLLRQDSAYLIEASKRLRIPIEGSLRTGLNIPYVNSPYSNRVFRDGFKEKELQKEELRKEVIKIQADEAKRVHALGMTVAFLTVADARDVDPSLLLTIAQGQSAGNLTELLTEEQLKKAFTDPNFRKKWMMVGSELLSEIEKQKSSLEMFDFNSLTPDIIGAYTEKAQAIVESLKKLPYFQRKAKELRASWTLFKRSALSNVGKSGAEASAYLSKTIPSTFIAEMSVHQFAADMNLAFWFVPYFGARADFANPEALAADPNTFDLASNVHRQDGLNEIASYLIATPADYALSWWQSERDTRVSIYNDPLYSLAEGTKVEESPWRTLARFATSAMNVRKIQYGQWFSLAYWRSLGGLQSTLFMGVAGRWILLGMNPINAVFSTLCYFYARITTWAWMWAIRNKGMELAGAELEAYNKKLIDVRVKMIRALEHNSPAAMFDAAHEISSLYVGTAFYDKMDAELRNLVDFFQDPANKVAIETPLPHGALNTARAIGETHEELYLNPELSTDQANDEARKTKLNALDKAIREAQGEARLGEGMEGQTLQINALSLLRYNLRLLPFANALNKSTAHATTMFTALCTIYVGIFVLAASQEKDVFFAIPAAILAAKALTFLWVGRRVQELFNKVWDTSVAPLAKEVGEGVRKVRAAMGCRRTMTDVILSR